MNAEVNIIEALKLVVDVPVEGSSQDVEKLNQRCYLSLNNSILTPSGSETDEDAMIVYSEKVVLQQVKKERRIRNYSFIALPIPFQVLRELDELCFHHNENLVINNNYTMLKIFQYMNKSTNDAMNHILHRIHSCLIQLQVFGLLGFTSRNDDYYMNVNHRNRLSLLLLKIPTFESIECNIDAQTEYNQILYAILQEINGEPIQMAPTCVIQAILISEIEFRSRLCGNVKVEENHDMKILELPLCPVCRFRIEPRFLKLPSPKLHRRCSRRQNDHCENIPFLAPWEHPNICEACALLQEYLKLSGARPFVYSHTTFRSNHNVQERLRCYDCNMEETLWVCLTCGIVGCGRYSQGHAEHHYEESSHPFSLELASQRIWDYQSGSFVHRDDILNCPFMKYLLGPVHRGVNHESSCGTIHDGESEMQDAAKKSHFINEEYDALLESALEDQAQYFEGEICRLQSSLAAELFKNEELSDEQIVEIESLRTHIESLRAEVSILGSEIVDAQTEEASHRTIANSMLREQAANKTLLDQIKNDIDKEVLLHDAQVEDLQLQISDLEANLNMRQQIAQSQDLSHAQIIGTSSERKKAARKSTRKSARK